MTEKEFNAAKLVWVNFIEHEVGKVTDLHGDEYDYIFKHLSQEMRSTVTSCCDRENCQQHRTKPREERGGITVGYAYYSYLCEWLHVYLIYLNYYHISILMFH